MKIVSGLVVVTILLVTVSCLKQENEFDKSSKPNGANELSSNPPSNEAKPTPVLVSNIEYTPAATLNISTPIRKIDFSNFTYPGRRNLD